MKKRILILQNIIPHYRKALFNLLANEYDLTVVHSGAKTVTISDKYNEIVVPRKKIGKFCFQIEILTEINNGYDVIIAMCDFHWPLNFLSQLIRPKKTKYIYWGSWLTNKSLVDKVKVLIAKSADANIFYCERDKQNFLRHKVPSEKLFVANNTFDVGMRVESHKHNNKFRILFVGSLDPRKNNEYLIFAFNNIKHKIDKHIILTIVGEGKLESKLKEMVVGLGLSDRIFFEGKITDNGTLLRYYNEAIVSVSYGQAGLSILQSLGFGVPFITSENAISGGEITNIINGYNGFLCDGSLTDLEEKLMTMCFDGDKAREMGENAFKYYSKNCTIENMFQGFRMAIES